MIYLEIVTLVAIAGAIFCTGMVVGAWYITKIDKGDNDNDK